MRRGTKIQVFVGAVGLVCLLLVVVYNVHHYVSLEELKKRKDTLMALANKYPNRSAAAFFGLYVAFTAFSIPGSLVLTLAGGALFGLFEGLVLVSYASSIGATLAFLMSRYVLRDFVQARFGDRLRTINDGIAKEGGFYLFSLRLIPVVPFTVLNLLMGLSSIRTPVFFLVSQLGMLPATVVFVDAGTRLAKVDSVRDILSPSVALSFIMIGGLPLILHKIVLFLKSKRKRTRELSSKELAGVSLE
mmetsp:Transcript_14162/g.30493  ORF Transcript_14162/g.30493 Transcript_14162/m.30493 type:complete len:246 (+) Transcript_14162:147-884(+)